MKTECIERVLAADEESDVVIDELHKASAKESYYAWSARVHIHTKQSSKTVGLQVVSWCIIQMKYFRHTPH